MEESTEVHSGDDFAKTIFDLSRPPSVALEGQVATVLLVICHVAHQSLKEMPRTERDDVISAFSADGTEHALGVRILPGRFPGTDHFFDAYHLDLLLEHPAVDRGMYLATVDLATT